MEDFLESSLPTLLTAALFLVVMYAVLRAALRPLGKVAFGMAVLVLLGILSPETVQGLFVGFVDFIFDTFEAAYFAVVL